MLFLDGIGSWCSHCSSNHDEFPALSDACSGKQASQTVPWEDCLQRQDGRYGPRLRRSWGGNGGQEASRQPGSIERGLRGQNKVQSEGMSAKMSQNELKNEVNCSRFR